MPLRRHELNLMSFFMKSLDENTLSGAAEAIANADLLIVAGTSLRSIRRQADRFLSG